MSKLRLILATALVAGLSLAFAGSAFAAAAGCGQCHGVYVNDNHGGKSVLSGTAAFEDSKTPQDGDICNNKGRGLHGIHMNYSSASYGVTGSTNNYYGTAVVRRGNCNYCHNKHVHENGFVEFSGMSAAGAQKITSAGHLSVSGTGIDSRGLDITTMDGSATCAAACHLGTSATNTAIWGNYTAAAVKLSCTACHADATNATTTNISIGHSLHIAAMGGTNTACHNCHPDNTGEGKAANDKGAKAYPHASDGTNVVPANAEVGTSNAIQQFTFNSGTLTCSGVACHIGDVVWTDAITANSAGCATCHNYPGAVGGKGDWTGANGHMARATSFQNSTTPLIRQSIRHLNKATAYSQSSDVYGTVTGDDKLCGKCHKGASHWNRTVDVADGAGNRGACGSSFTYTNISSNPANRIANCSNVSCHFGKTTPNWF